MATSLAFILAICLMACAVSAQQEGEEMMVTPFSDILGQVLQRVDSMNQPGAQQQIITHGPQGGFEIQIDFNSDDDSEASQEEGDVPFPGQRGGPANIFGRMFQRMRQMRERMDDVFQNGQKMQREQEVQATESPFKNYLQSKVNGYVHGGRLLDDCEQELEKCPEAMDTQVMVNCLKEQIHELSPQCEEELDSAEDKLGKKQKKVNEKHRRITREMQRMCEEELPKFCGLPEAPQFTLFQRSMRSQDLLDNKLACLVKNLPELGPDTECHKLIQSVATHWGEFEVKDAKRKELRANLADKCGEDLAANATCQRIRCPHDKLQCLAESADTLSPGCTEFVTMRVSVLDAQMSKDGQLKEAHKSCKQTFNDATGECKEMTDMSDIYKCINDAKKAMSSCLEESDTKFAAAVMPSMKHHHHHKSDDESSDEEGEGSWWKKKERKWAKKLKHLKERFQLGGLDDEGDKSGSEDEVSRPTETPAAAQSQEGSADRPSLAPKHEEQTKQVLSKEDNRKQEPPPTEDDEYVMPDDADKVADQAMVIAFGALLMLVVVGILCMIMKRSPQHYELEAMHMTIQGSSTSHDQL